MKEMKRRTAAGILMILAVFLFWNLNSSGRCAAGIRTVPPVKGENGTQYYYNKANNPFYPDVAPFRKTKDGYVTGNCTWYAWGRACEIAGEKLPHVFTGDAGTWWSKNKEENWYDYGSKPRCGAIICYKTHVGIVEQEKPLIISESGWEVSKNKNRLIFHCGEPWRSKEKPLGYIYVEK